MANFIFTVQVDTSMIASSILKRKGIHKMTDVIGGFQQ